MKVACISDGHGYLPKIPECDLLLYAGDICPIYDHSLPFQDMWLQTNFATWVRGLPAKHVIWVKGNHDLTKNVPWTCSDNEYKDSPGCTTIMSVQAKSKKVIYLEDSFWEIQGLKVFGSPNQLPYGRSWAFNKTEEELEQIYSKVDSADIIVSHGPPYGYGDKVLRYVAGKPVYENAGSKALLNLIDRVKPKLCVFGHIHLGRGTYQRGNSILVNASLLNDNYIMVNKPIVVEI